MLAECLWGMFVLHTTALSQTVQKQLCTWAASPAGEGLQLMELSKQKQEKFLMEMANRKKEGT